MFEYQKVILQASDVVMKTQELLDDFSKYDWRLVSITSYSEKNLEDKVIFIFERKVETD